MRPTVRAAVLAILFIAAPQLVAALLPPPPGEVLDDFDIRELQANAAPHLAEWPELQAAIDARLGVPVRLSMDAYRDVPKTINPRRPALYLTPPSTDDPLTVTRRFLLDHADLYGLSPTEIDGLEVDTDYVTEHQRWHTLWLQQRVDGVKVFGARIGTTVAQESGRLLRINAGPIVAGLTPSAKPPMPVEQAIYIAAEQINQPFEIGDEALELLEQAPRHEYRFAPAHFDSEIQAELVYFPMAAGARLAWYVILDSARYPAMYEVILDADSGELLLRGNATNYFIYQARAYPIDPSATPARIIYSLHETDTSPQSPLGWYDIDRVFGITISNNVTAHSDRTGCVADGPFGDVTDTVPFYDFNFPIDLTREPITYIEAAITNLFVINNMIHDRLYDYGFNEVSGNFQLDNLFFLPPGDGDRDEVDAQAQDARDCVPPALGNANFFTPADGGNGRMQMYLWSGSPERDGDLDADIIIHEFGHGVSNRLVGGRTCVNACALGAGSNQSRAMGESWGDLLQGSYANDDALAEYSTGNPDGLRTERFSLSSYTLSDIGQVFGPGSCQVHADGEVWSRAMWAIREAFVDVFGLTTGAQKFERYIIDSLKLMPTLPSFLDARDATIDAAVNLFEECLMWQGFAEGGMGENATASGNCPPSTVFEDFAMPARCACTPGAPGVDRNSLLAGPRAGVTSEWQWGSPDSGTWNLHSSTDKRRVDNASAGALWRDATTVIAAPTSKILTDSVGSFPVGYYQVYGADGCTGLSQQP